MNASGDARPHVVIVGGGLAGLAAAVALAESDCRVELFESRRTLGGRAGSFNNPTTGETVDHCQHVSMGCCTNLADFCRRVGVSDLFRQDRVLHFIAPDGRAFSLQASRLPAPLHLAPSFWRLKYLSVSERLAIGRATWKLMRLRPVDDADSPTIGEWLKQHGQSPQAIELYWNVILVSALGEELERASLSAARKVIVDGFLSARDSYVVEVPRVPLAKLYGDTLEKWLARHGVAVHLGSPVQTIGLADRPIVKLNDQREVRPDFVVSALPWFRLPDVVDVDLAGRWPWLDAMTQVDTSPITGVHLWFDRPIMPYQHAVLLGRMSQWVFHRADASEDPTKGHYYQVVVSASRNLAGRQRSDIIDEVRRELAAIWPDAQAAQLLHARVVTEHAAVFSVRPGLDRARPNQSTGAPNVFVAGDWTDTGWPATMESAVRSGYLAAEGVLAALGRPTAQVVGDLPRGWLARMLIRD